MHRPTKIDYEKLLGFDLVSDELAKEVDFNSPTVGAKLGAKIGPLPTKTEEPMLLDPPSEVAPGAPMLRGLGGRKVAST